jgi:hypothetical protein
MARYGWKEGQGLGAKESGILNPVTAEVASTAATSKRKGQKGKAAEPASKTSAFGGTGKGRGSIASELKNERQREERERYGEPSTVVLLTNMVGLEDVGDPDLPGEIGKISFPSVSYSVAEVPCTARAKILSSSARPGAPCSYSGAPVVDEGLGGFTIVACGGASVIEGARSWPAVPRASRLLGCVELTDFPALEICS